LFCEMGLPQACGYLCMMNCCFTEGTCS